MLAYVFWHWPRPGVAREQYHAAQRAFHAALAADPPAGFRGSSCHLLSGAPWAAEGGAAWEDWYLQDDSAALDRLNQAAVAAGRKVAHDRAAALFGGGAAGLYQLEAGGPALSAPVASWFGKPEGWSYARLLEAVSGGAAGGALWKRWMGLGPAPEFCLRSAVPPTFPDGIEARMITMAPVWPA